MDFPVVYYWTFTGLAFADAPSRSLSSLSPPVFDRPRLRHLLFFHFIFFFSLSFHRRHRSISRARFPFHFHRPEKDIPPSPFTFCLIPTSLSLSSSLFNLVSAVFFCSCPSSSRPFRLNHHRIFFFYPATSFNSQQSASSQHHHHHHRYRHGFAHSSAHIAI